VQWFSLVAILACVYEIAVFLSFSSTSALFSILISLTFPVLMLQTYSFQGDVTVATLIMIANIFILKGRDQNRYLFFLTAVLAICLAIGTKQTSFFVLPVLAIYMLFYLFKRFTVIACLKIVGISLIIFFVFSSYTYIQNYIFTKQVFGYYDTGKTAFSYMENLNNKAKYVFPRYFYQAISVEGLPRYVQTDLLRIKGNLFKSFLIPRGINLESDEHIQPGSSDNEKFTYYALPYMNEENAWFGFLAFPVILVTLVLSFLRHKKIIRDYALFIFALSVIYTLFIFLQRPGWDPYQGRYFILIIAPLIPLISIIVPKRRPWNLVVIFTLLPGVMFLALNVFFTNSSKPIINSRQIYGFQSKHILPLPEDSRIEIIAKNYLVKISNRIANSAIPLSSIFSLTYIEQLYSSDLKNVENLTFIHANTQDANSLSFTIGREPIEYGLFGKNMIRELFPVVSSIEAQGSYYLVYSTVDIPFSDKLVLAAENNDYKIYKILP
jgi:hypothetical protein